MKIFRRRLTNLKAPSFNNLGLIRSGPGAFDGLRSFVFIGSGGTNSG